MTPHDPCVSKHLFVFDEFLAGSVPAAHLGDAVGL
jgi:hypothetical protein